MPNPRLIGPLGLAVFLAAPVLWMGPVCGDVVDITNPDQPVALNGQAEPGRPSAPPAGAPSPMPPNEAASGELVKSQIVIETPQGRRTQSVAEALKIKRGKKLVRTIRTPMFIHEWHFIAGGREVEVCAGPLHGPGVHQLYDVASGRVLATVRDPLGAEAPAWARSH